MIDCGGDEYSVRGDYTFDRVPLSTTTSPASSSASSMRPVAEPLGHAFGFLYKFS